MLRRMALAVGRFAAPKPTSAALFFATNAPPAGAADAPLVFGSCVCREGHYRLPLFRWWCECLREVPRYHRKLWEFVYICQVLHEHGMLAAGMRGVGFGVGREPLAALFASRGAEIVATDMEADAAREAGWLQSAQHAGAELEALNDRGICAAERFNAAVSYRSVDMNAIPDDLIGFDFCWSSCACEHLGSIDSGLAFLRGSMKVLRPGGVAVHTTEYNLSSDERTVDSGPTVLFRQRDLVALETALKGDGHAVAPFDFQTGREPVERYVDLPPYCGEPHLRMRPRAGFAKFATTSIGMVVVKGR
jgi:SAM-dependent methyltransferase